MKSLLTAVAGAALLLCNTSAGADAVNQIISQGMDGEATYYVVICKSGREGSVVVHDTTVPKACAAAAGKDEKCTGYWNINKAADYVCK